MARLLLALRMPTVPHLRVPGDHCGRASSIYASLAAGSPTCDWVSVLKREECGTFTRLQKVCFPM